MDLKKERNLKSWYGLVIEIQNKIFLSLIIIKNNDNNMIMLMNQTNKHYFVIMQKLSMIHAWL